MSRLGALRERQFRLLFFGRTASLLGSAFAPVALAFAVLDDLNGSATDLGVVLAAIWIPQVFFILVGGVWADRLPRNLVMVSTDLVMFAAQGTVAALLIGGHAELWQLIVLQVVRGIANAFFFPASTGLIPSVVSPGRLQQANALLRLANSTTSIVGAGLAGLVVGGVGPGWALAFDAATFLVSAAFVVQVRVPAAARHAASSFVHELRVGWGEFASRTWLWAIVVQFMFINAFTNGTYLVLGPVIAKEHLGGASAWGLILAGFAAGSVIGGVIALRWRPKRLLLAASLAVLLGAPVCFLLAVPASLVVLIAASALGGIGVEVFSRHVGHRTSAADPARSPVACLVLRRARFVRVHPDRPLGGRPPVRPTRCDRDPCLRGVRERRRDLARAHRSRRPDAAPHGPGSWTRWPSR